MQRVAQESIEVKKEEVVWIEMQGGGLAWVGSEWEKGGHTGQNKGGRRESGSAEQRRCSHGEEVMASLKLSC